MQDCNKRKQYGKYCGPLLADVKDAIRNWPEQKLFIEIQSFVIKEDTLEGDMLEGIIKTDLDLLSSYQYAIEFLVMQTSRFGVEFEEPKEGEHLKYPASYEQWFIWWSEYLDYTISSEEKDDLKSRLEKNVDVSMYRPEGDWRKSA